MKNKRIMAVLMAATVVGGMMTSAHAATPRSVDSVTVTQTQKVSTHGTSGTAKVNLVAVNDDSEWVSGDTFSAVIPAIIPMSMDASGSILTPSNATIKNMNIERDIKVTAIQVTGANGWTVADYSTGDFATDDAKNIAMSINTVGTNGSGVIDVSTGTWKVGAADTLALTIAAKGNKQTVAGNKGQVASIAFTLDWAN